MLEALIAARVLSPQYLLWLCPLLAVVGGWQGRFGLVIAAGLTSLVYPVLYTDLVDSETAGHGRALAAAVARNVLLVVLYAFLVRRAVRPLPDATPAPAPEAPAVPS